MLQFLSILCDQMLHYLHMVQINKYIIIIPIFSIPNHMNSYMNYQLKIITIYFVPKIFFYHSLLYLIIIAKVLLNLINLKKVRLIQHFLENNKMILDHELIIEGFCFLY